MANYVEMARQFLVDMAQGSPTASHDTVVATPSTILVQTAKVAPVEPDCQSVTSADRAEPDAGPPPEELALSLKSHAIELWCDHAGGRVFIVADEADAQEAMRRFDARRGEVWLPGEIELVGRIEDQAIRDEVADFKRQMNGRFSRDTAGARLSPEALKAAALNKLFQEQGVTGQPGRIKAETVRDGEHKAGAEQIKGGKECLN
jgi:hypothetical protein